MTVGEGETANNTGTFSDPGADIVTISASVGTVSQVGTQNGTWSWSFDTSDGPNETQTVTITATDSDGLATDTTFALVVDNVAPTVGLGPDLQIFSFDSNVVEIAFSDPGVNDGPWVYVIDWDDGTISAGSTNDQSVSITASHQYIPLRDYIVEACVTDKDNDTVCDTQVLTVQGIRDLKQSALTQLSSHVDESKRFEKAVKEIEKSLALNLWDGEIRLDSKKGKKVFDRERHAVKELMHLLKGDVGDKCGGVSRIAFEYTGSGTVTVEVFLKKTLLGTFTVSTDDDDFDSIFEVLATAETDGKLHPELSLVVDGDEAAKVHTSCSKPIDSGDVHGDFVIDDLDTLPGKEGKAPKASDLALEAARIVIDDLVLADRILAGLKIQETDASPVLDPKRQDKVDKELARARDEFAKGDADRDAGKPDKAIQHYRKAWDRAGKAAKEAAKT